MKDVIIVGAGPAGLTAAIYVQRAGYHALVLDAKGYGGQIVNTAVVENYPGLPSVSGVDFAQSLYEQAKNLGAEIRTERVSDVWVAEDGSVRLQTQAESYTARTAILATGAENRVLGIDGEARLTGSGVSFCATCDGNFFRNRDVAVIGGGNTALEDAEVLAGLAKKVYLVHRRDSFRGDQMTVKRLASMENVEFVLNSVPISIGGNFAVENLLVSNRESGQERVLDVQGVFIAIGQTPANEVFPEWIEKDEAGYARSDESCMTSKEAVFVAGDCRAKGARQLTTAVSDGTNAALSAVAYLQKHS